MRLSLLVRGVSFRPLTEDELNAVPTLLHEPAFTTWNHQTCATRPMAEIAFEITVQLPSGRTERLLFNVYQPGITR